jgi:DNA-binding transcriptional LysR family regulator
VLGRLEQSHPVFEYKLYVDTMEPTAVVQAIADGQADIGVVSLPVDLGRCELQWSGQAPCVLALSAHHPLAKESVVNLSQLGNHTVITMSNRTRLRHRLSTALLQPGPDGKPRRHIETSSSLNALMLVREGVGIALVDPFTAAMMSPAGVVFRPIDRHVPYMVGVITHRDRGVSNEGRRLIDALWDDASRLVSRFTAGDPSGLPSDIDPYPSVRRQDSQSA